MKTKQKEMKVKDLIKELQQIEDTNKYIHLLGNTNNPECEDTDVIFDDIEIWDDGDESITLFLLKCYEETN
tara:strand:- start:365 stop:577 length:213 start_codon:yes stop_codon:yes gene_type:complete